MKTKVITVLAVETVEHARTLFHKHHIHHLPVLDDEKKVVGMLSIVDTNVFEPNQMLVGEVMVSDVQYIRDSATTEEAVQIFANNHFHALPVINQRGFLVGMITTNDLLKGV